MAQPKLGIQTRQMKEAFFETRVRQDIQVRKGEVRKEKDFARGQPKLSTKTSARKHRNTGQVVIQCRVNNRLVSLRQLTQSLKRLSTGDELLPRVIRSPSGCAVAEPEGEEDECPSLSFTAPSALLKPPYAHPLRIFDVIRGVMTWKKFPSAALASLSNSPTLTSSWAPRMSDPFNSDILPTMAPTALNGLPEDMTEELLDGPSESTGVSLTPEMIRAEFPLPENVPSTPRQLKDDSFKDDSSSPSPCKTPQMMPVSTVNTSRESREQQLEMFLKSQTNRLGAKVTARLNHLNIVGKANSPSTPDNK
ncbi:uncharacterized protein LOC110497099 [Oncorhynchus mykiss]|uniref:uncharacterized protein LOC110497099 n=1 Tax=Oncorhynchus mykiss TaxID=8022 RepID=UPI00187870CD|nr:uncharacterized protein LOC110497099 [Oncorhynchus mykiss]